MIVAVCKFHQSLANKDHGVGSGDNENLIHGKKSAIRTRQQLNDHVIVAEVGHILVELALWD